MLCGARVLAIGFGSLLIYALTSVVWMRCGRCGALAAGVLLATSPSFLNLSFSVMLEVPAFATGMVAVWFLFRWLERRRPCWLLLSSLVMGCALQIKLTAAFVLPALAAEVILGETGAGRPERFVDTINGMLVWLSGLAITFAAIAIFSGETFGPMWKSHTHVVSAARPVLIGSPGLRFSAFNLLGDLGMLAPAVLGFLAIVWRGQWRRMIFPLAFLTTCFVVHLLHRPYWYYYYLHFLVPMAWIGGYGLSASATALRAAFARGVREAPSVFLWFGWLGICAGTILVLEGGPSLRRELDSLRGLPRAGNDRLLQKICENAATTQWFYSDEYIYPFLARLRVPPELVILPSKRFWSGQLDGEGILRCVRRYQPEQVLLSRDSKMSSEWEQTDATNYFVAYEGGGYRLFVAKRIARSSAWPVGRARRSDH
jgi:hypothetical protein